LVDEIILYYDARSKKTSNRKNIKLDSRTVYVAYSVMTLPTSLQKQACYWSATRLPTLYIDEHISYTACECEDPGRVANGFSKSTVIRPKTGKHLGYNICVEWTLHRSC